MLWAFRERMRRSEAGRPAAATSSCSRITAPRPGATLEHSHSQLIALPIVPDFVREEIDGARRHFAEKERCVFCDIIRQELAAARRVVQENADIVALAPYAPRFPFETWLLPRRHGARFEDAPRARVREPGAAAEGGAARGSIARSSRRRTT